MCLCIVFPGRFCFAEFIFSLVLQCSVTCGSGIRTRSLECSDKDVSCDAGTKPPTTERCELKACPEWKASLWGEVNAFS